MRIGHLPSLFLPQIGGAQIATHNIAEKQTLLGYDVHLMTRNTANWKAYKALQKELSYPLLPFLPKTLRLIQKGEKLNLDFSTLLGLQLQYYQHKYKFDVWHLNLISPFAIYSLPHLRKLGVPLIGTCRGRDIQKYPEVGYGWRINNPKWEKKLIKALTQFDLVTAISNSVREEYLSLGVPEEKIRMVSNGVNFDYIKDYQIDRAAIRNAVGWPQDKNIIITVGRNHPKKGYKYIPEIIKLLLNKRKDFLWVVVGKNAEPIQALAEEMGVSSHLKVMAQIGLKKRNDEVKYHFPSGDLVALYKAADVFAFPTLIETFGNVNIEAMASKLPVVVTDAPGCRDIVTHNQTGLVSKVGDVGEMANNIHKVLEEENLREKLIDNGFRYAESIRWPVIAQKYVDCYQEAIDLRKERLMVSVTA